MACSLRRCRGKRGCICPKARASSAPSAVMELSSMSLTTDDDEDAKAAETVAQVFKQLDLDANAKIDRMELSQVLSHLDSAYWTAKRLRALFRAADMDRDQFIDWREFCTWVFKRGPDQEMLLSTAPVLGVKQEEVKAALVAAETIPSLVAALESAERLINANELEKHRKRLQSMRQSFSLTIVTLTGDEIEVEAVRSDTFEQVKRNAAVRLDVLPYRIRLATEGGEVPSDTTTLEGLGICDASIKMVVSVGECQKFLEMSRQHFVDLVIARRLSTQAEMERLYKSGADDDSIRQRFTPQLEELEAIESKENERRLKNKLYQRRQFEALASSLVAAVGVDDFRQQIDANIAECEVDMTSLTDQCASAEHAFMHDRGRVAALAELDASICALTSLDKRNLAETCDKTPAFAQPSPLAKVVMEALCVMFSLRPDWKEAKMLWCDSNFINKLTEYDRENIPKQVMNKLGKYIHSNEFDPEIVKNVSRDVALICRWICAMYAYGESALTYRVTLTTYNEKAQDVTLERLFWQSLQSKLRDLDEPNVAAVVAESLQMLMPESSELQVRQNVITAIRSRCRKIGGDHDAELDIAMQRIHDLKFESILELSVLLNPPSGVRLACSALFIMLGLEADWETSRQELTDPLKLIDRIYDFDKDNIPEATIEKMAPIIENAHFDPCTIKKASIVCETFCLWCRAIHAYHSATMA